MPSDLALTPAQIHSFIVDGFVCIDNAFSSELAATCRQTLWRATGCSESDPSTWTRPVVRVGEIPSPPFVEAANGDRLRAAFDTLVGPSRWLPRGSLGTFPIRFPSRHDPGDCGWHVDMSFGVDNPDFLSWRINLCSQGRALLMLFLFSDIGESDAPTRLRVASHQRIARRLAPHGKAGLSLRELAATRFSESADCEEAFAIGVAGTVYLCHPFLVHSAQRLLPPRPPRFLAQPALLPRVPLDPWRDQASPVELAIRYAIDEAEEGA